jgi:Protein of unknown function DUF262
MTSLFEKNEIEVVNLSQWLDWTSGNNEDVKIALPMIQRGSVWKPEQVINLWDSLLRGMPVGSFMLNKLKSDSDYYTDLVNRQKAHKLETAGFGLLDGQQRTMSMLLAWTLPNNERMDRRIWVDFFDTPSAEHLYRLRMTTKNHPFGFQRESPSTKLSQDDRRKARKAYEDEMAYLSTSEPSHATQDDKDAEKEQRIQIDLYKAKPYVSEQNAQRGISLPLDLHGLLDIWRKETSVDEKSVKEKWVVAVTNKLEAISKFSVGEGPPEKIWHKLSDEQKEIVKSRVGKFAESLEAFFSLQVPLIKVRPQVFEDAKDDTKEPALATLFKRIGTGGTALSNDDYVYSMIKHRYPQTHDLVESLHKGTDSSVASILSATDLVMTAFRLAAASADLTDYESPDNKNFHNIFKSNKDFLKNKFLPLLEGNDLKTAFRNLKEILLYSKDKNPHGVPLLYFPVLERPLVQVLLRWLMLNPTREQQIDSRDDILRFVMFWQLCVSDRRKSSVEAFKELLTGGSKFPAITIAKKLVASQLAIPIVSPKKLEALDSKMLLSTSPSTGGVNDGAKVIRGYNSRFIDAKDGESNLEKSLARKFYSFWWNKNERHEHPILLWLQRDYVSGEFKHIDPLAGRDEDTPFDYDHICPSLHWENWTGASKSEGTRITDFADDPQRSHHHIGNSIGNLRVWDSGKNRSDGADSPNTKLLLDAEKPEDISERETRLASSAIEIEQQQQWIDCSGEKESHRKWDQKRAAAFQTAVEMRTFYLYKRFFDELKFDDWTDESVVIKCTNQQP